MYALLSVLCDVSRKLGIHGPAWFIFALLVCLYVSWWKREKRQDGEGINAKRAGNIKASRNNRSRTSSSIRPFLYFTSYSEMSVITFSLFINRYLCQYAGWAREIL